MTLLETTSKKLQKVRNFGHQKVEFYDVQNRTFRTFPESPEIYKICKICKNHKNRKNLQNLQNLEKVRFFAVWRLPYVIGQNRCLDSKNRKISTFRKSADFWNFVSEQQKSRFRKIAKKSKIFGFSDLQKNRKSVLYAVEIDDRKWRHISLFGGKKNALFRAFFWVKEKNVPFSAILTCFWISRFFSKFDRFEGQRQRRPRKGSPSCPVIFHRTWYWKWSISTRVGPIFRTWDQFSGLVTKSTGLLRTCPLWWQVRKPGSDQSGRLQPGIEFWLQTSGWTSQVRKSGNPAKSWKSQKSQKSRLFRKTRDFSDFLDFRIGQDFRMVRSICVLSSLCSDPCAHCCPETASYNMHTARSNVHTHIDTRHSCQSAYSCHASILYSIARFCAIVRFENNFWNK